MENEKIKENNEIKENGKEIKTPGQLCMDEVGEILKKYNCRFICAKQVIYGQAIWVPIIEEIGTNDSK